MLRKLSIILIRKGSSYSFQYGRKEGRMVLSLVYFLTIASIMPMSTKVAIRYHPQSKYGGMEI